MEAILNKEEKKRLCILVVIVSATITILVCFTIKVTSNIRNINLAYKELKSLRALEKETCEFDGFYKGEAFTCMDTEYQVLLFSCSNGDSLYFLESNASKLIDWCNAIWGAQCSSFQRFVNSCDNPVDVRYYISGLGWDER